MLETRLGHFSFAFRLFLFLAPADCVNPHSIMNDFPKMSQRRFADNVLQSFCLLPCMLEVIAASGANCGMIGMSYLFASPRSIHRTADISVQNKQLTGNRCRVKPSGTIGPVTLDRCVELFTCRLGLFTVAKDIANTSVGPSQTF
jgi:hypothetical protein